MTNTPPPLTDEDLSAYLDDEVSPEVRARIEGDPKARERAQVLGRARDALRVAPVAPLSDDVVDSMIGRAIQELDSPDDAPVAPPASIQQRRRGRTSQSATWMVAASVVALVAIGIGLIWSGVESTETTDTADVAADAPTDTEGQAARQSPEAVEEGATADAIFEERPAASLEPAQVVDLGSHDSDAALRRSLAGGFAPDADPVPADEVATEAALAPTPITVGQLDSCIQQLGVRHGHDAEITDVGVAGVDDERYLVFDMVVEDDEAGDHLVAVVSVDHGCSPLITFYR